MKKNLIVHVDHESEVKSRVTGNIHYRRILKPLIIALLIFPAVVKAENPVKIDLSAISIVESSGNAKAINKADNGGIGSYGLHQVSPLALRDYNKAHKTGLKPSDLLKAETSTKVADWYLNREIPRLIAYYAKKHPNVKDTVPARLTAYNMGIGAVVKGRVAKTYQARYLRALNNVTKLRTKGV